MWPSALQLTRDECRGILRRLELESYSNVISVFRAQGGLTEPKAKLLEELRNIFHISQERHRAEARRVANDEQLSTIAEAISGPNTWQEWSREGRRPYPLLPRVPPQTALNILANNVAAEITNENSKLPYPADTGAAVQQQHQQFSTECTSESVPVVTSDPAKGCAKPKTSKAELELTQTKLQTGVGLELQADFPEIRKNLKRNLPSDTLTLTKKRIVSEVSPSATASELPLSTSTQIRKLYHNHSKTQSKQRNALAKKVNHSPAKRPTAATKKQRLISGDSVDSNKANNAVCHGPNNSQLPIISTAAISLQNTNIEPLPPPPPPPQPASSQDVVIEPHEKTTPIPATPQIATSKKDISKNLSKLNMIANQPVQQQECKTEKLATPVQKYIVEERTPMMVSNASTLTSHLLEKQQIIASKAKPMTAIVPTPLSATSKAKITNVKTLKSSDIVCSTPLSSQPQVFNVIDASTPPYVPHTPPAIINLSSKFEPEHGKVLTTKLLPLMLSAGGKLESSNGNHSHGKNIAHPNPATQTTVFRKPNIIKSNVPMKQKIQITNQQIISPPTVTNLKVSPHLHLKGVPGGGPIHNRKSVKIFSSPNGKMFIQSADAAKQMGTVNTILSTQKASGHLVNSGNANPNRIAIQKVQIFPASTSTSTVSVVPKPMAITKPNMIFMPMPTTPTVKSLPIVKGSKFSTILPTHDAVATASGAKSNVFVIGTVQSPPQKILPKDMHGFNNRNNMITEDTPVDIISTPIIMDVDSIETQSMKSSETIDLTTIVDNSTHPASPSPSRAKVIGTTIPTSTVLQSRLAAKSSDAESAAKSNTAQEMDDDVLIVSDGNTSGGNDVATMVIGVTDWEMELDQEANKARAIYAHKTTSHLHSNTDSMRVGSGGEEGSSADEHFVDDDVIEEQEETEEETDDGCDTAGGDTRISNDRNECETHEEEEQHMHHHHNNDEEEDEAIEVGDEQMKSEGDVIQYDESYESANDDMDDNIAIEYVEEDHDGYEDKTDLTSNDPKETMECNSNIVLIKQSNNLSADALESGGESKSQSSNDCMVSVEEISSTTQQNVTGSHDEL